MFRTSRHIGRTERGAGASSVAVPPGARGGSRARLGFVAAAFVALLIAGTAAVLGAATPAHAANGCYRYQFLSDGLQMKVENASFDAGARIIQMASAPNAAEFEWCPTTSVYTTGGFLVNQRSGLCLNTDGIAGHWLTQERCDGRYGERWTFFKALSGAYSIQTIFYGLAVDVFHDSHSEGAVIDGWYQSRTLANNQLLYELDV